MTIRTKISFLMMVMIGFALCSSGLFYLHSLRKSLRDSVFSGLNSVSHTSVEAISRFINDSMKEAGAIGLSLPVEAIEQRNIPIVEEKLKLMLNAFPEFENGIFILDRDGELWVDYPQKLEHRGKSFAFREYFQRSIQEGHGVMSTPYLSERTGEPVITFTSLLRGPSNEFLGVLGCSVRLLSDKTFEGIRKVTIGTSGYIYVYNKSRLMILHPQRERILQRDVPPNVNRLFDSILQTGDEITGETVNSRGIPMLAHLAPIAGTDWILVVQQPQKEAYLPIKRATNSILLTMAIGIAVTGAVTAFCIRKVTAPILKLRDAAIKIEFNASEGIVGPYSEGNDPLHELERDRSDDELGELSDAFRHMSERLDETLLSLRKAATDWEDTFNSVPDAIMLLDRNHRILRVNRSSKDLLGMDPLEAVGKHCYELVHKTNCPPDFCPHMETDTTGRLATREIDDPDSGRILKVVTFPLRDGAGNMIGSIHITRDITERKQIEETLQKTKDMLQSLIEAAPIAINVVDHDGNIMMWNPASEQIFGWKEEEVLGLFNPLILEDKQPEFLKMLSASFEGKGLSNFQTRRRTKDGSVRDVSLSTAPVHDGAGEVMGALGIMLDVTEQKRLEANLRQAQKMEAIGTLAGGIAHDFNNILGAIVGYTDLSFLEASEDSPVRRHLEQILIASNRARELVRQILAFSRQTEMESKPIKVSPVIKEALWLIRASIPATIQIEEEIESNNDIVVADPTQIHQVLMNLCTNAAHAMREKGGLLKVVLKTFYLDEDAIAKIPMEVQPGSYLRLSVRDTGHGIDPKTMERIFDPYFTTKEKGTGTGLGLATVQGIVKNFGGWIELESAPGAGSTFLVFFPVIEQQPIEQTAAPQVMPGGAERILLVDDEYALIEVGKQMLEHLGYSVITSTSSLEALEVFRAQPEGFDLVFTDMTMPNMTGAELAEEILRIRPEISIILCTGFSESLIAEKARLTGISEFAMKPLLLNDVAVIVRRALDRGNSI